TERLTPGWSVTVDGRPAPVVRTNLHFRGVEVGPGVHRVEWRYAPAFWWPLVALSAVTLLACAAGGAWLAIRGSRRPSDPPPPSAAGGG
ncbi:MAG: YfhO family protein, partial [Anaeromyxobacteraceae bacterium]|nr:YfhO family protein [Anaeromyxobacteraceae bacterium]